MWQGLPNSATDPWKVKTLEHWKDQTLGLPPSLTRGRSTLTIKSAFISSSTDFNEFMYRVDQKVNGKWTHADTVDVGPDHTADETAHQYSITAQTWVGSRNYSYPD
jgi:hypothetical protein